MGDIQGRLNFEGPTPNLRSQAERALKAAQQLGRANDALAEPVFQEAARLADQAADPELQLRAYESLGLFLKSRGKFGPARECFRKAELTAEYLDSDESISRLRVRIFEAETELPGNDKLKPYFVDFKEASKEGSYTWQDRFETWCSFVDDLNTSTGRLAARGIGSKKDFRDRLEGVKRDRAQA